MAQQDSVVPNGSGGGSNGYGGDMTLTVVGCGTLGIAILSGIISSIQDSTPRKNQQNPPRTPTRFIACVQRDQSAARIRDSLSHPSLKILQNQNVKGVQAADVIILACKPYQIEGVLQENGMRAALHEKLLISILAGVTVRQITDTLAITGISSCQIVRAMPNTAAVVRESMTMIAASDPPLEPSQSALVTWIFSQLGLVVHLPANLADASTALCGSGPALYALMLESMADGAVAMGIPRAEAQLMASQAMLGTAKMVLAGEHPALIREKVSTPGGCTIGGLLVLEEGRVRGTVARSVREATVVASQLGKGMQGVNGTRF